MKQHNLPTSFRITCDKSAMNLLKRGEQCHRIAINNNDCHEYHVNTVCDFFALKRGKKAFMTNARLMASALSLALDPTFGIHSHKTLDTVQACHLLKPN